MTLALHQSTSSAAGYRKSLEGWARAGITQVELTGNLVDEFLKTDTIAGARQILSDLGADTGSRVGWRRTTHRAE